MEGEDETSSEDRTAKEAKSKDAILEQARNNIEKKRNTSLTVNGLKPNTRYQLQSFPIGTSAKGIVLVGSERLKEMYPEEADEVDKGFEILGDDEYLFQYRRILQESFAAIVPEEPLLWETTSRSGEEDYRFPDEVIHQLKKENGGIDGMQGHCVFWSKRVHLPEHLRGADKGRVIETLLNERLEVVRRYLDVKRWVLVNEPIQHSPRVVDGVDRNELVLDPQKDIDTYVELFRKAKEANPEARFIVNEYNVLSGEKLDDYISFINELMAKGAPIDGIGVQAHISDPETYSVGQVQKSLEKLTRLGLPITVTELDVVGKAFKSEADRAQYFENILTVFCGNEDVEGVYIWGIQEKTHWRGKEGAGLYDENFSPNEVGSVLEDVGEKWSTKTTVITDEKGSATLSGFAGVYRVTESKSKKTKPVEITSR